jgi:hypothetical protein
MEVEMNDRSVRMVMFGALLAALVACCSNSQPAKTQFASADDLGTWLSSNGFGCTRDDSLGGAYMCTYAGGTDSWQFQYTSDETRSKRPAWCQSGLANKNGQNIAGRTWVLYSGHGGDKLPAMLDTIKAKGLTDGRIVKSCG